MQSLYQCRMNVGRLARCWVALTAGEPALYGTGQHFRVWQSRWDSSPAPDMNPFELLLEVQCFLWQWNWDRAYNISLVVLAMENVM